MVLCISRKKQLTVDILYTR